MRLSFRARLRLVFVGLSAGLLLVALLVVNDVAESAVADRVSNDFQGALAAFDDIVNARLRGFDKVVEATVSDQVFRSQLSLTRVSDADLGLGGDSGGDTHTVSDAHDVFASVDLPLFRDYPVLAILDHSGTLVFSRAASHAFGDDLSQVPAVARALAGGKAVVLWSAHDPKLIAAHLVPPKHAAGLYLVMAEPITVQGNVLGVLLVGEPVAHLRPQLELASGGEVAFTTPNETAFDASAALAPSMPTVRRLVKRLSGAALEHPRVVSLHGQRWLAEIAPLRIPAEKQGIGRALLLKSLDKELSGFRRLLRFAIFGIALLALLGSFLIGGLLARRLSEPLVELEDGARRVAGGDLDTKVEVHRDDEFGRLGRAFNEMTRGLKQRDEIKATFKRYLAPTVVEELIQHPDKVDLGGESRELTILFSDLVGFTSLSEGRSASDLVALLNEYFDAVVAPIAREGGTLDKFAGDSVMCFFGAPIAQPDHRRRALFSALDHLAVVDRLSAAWRADGRPAIDCRIGLNTGEVVVGNIGSHDGQDYTVIGDAVNLASRLESANKAYGTRLMVAESVLEGCESLVAARELDLLRVKGKQQGVRVLEVLARAGELDGAHETLLARFAEGRAAYLDRKFADALRAFEACLEIVPGDHPSEVFVKRCRAFIETPPPPEWNGVFVLETK